jgi:hypothetical protein
MSPIPFGEASKPAPVYRQLADALEQLGVMEHTMAAGE